MNSRKLLSYSYPIASAFSTDNTSFSPFLYKLAHAAALIMISYTHCSLAVALAWEMKAIHAEGPFCSVSTTAFFAVKYSATYYIVCVQCRATSWFQEYLFAPAKEPFQTQSTDALMTTITAVVKEQSRCSHPVPKVRIRCQRCVPLPIVGYRV